MLIPEEALKAIKKTVLDNHYFYHADEFMARLELVYLEKVPYISPDLSNLINTLELYYKGFLYSKQEQLESYKFASPDFLKKDHDLFKFAEDINNNFIDLYDISARRQMRQFYLDLKHKYTSNRYTDYSTIDDFKQLYVYVKSQEKILKDSLLEKRNSTKELTAEELDMDI